MENSQLQLSHFLLGQESTSCPTRVHLQLAMGHVPEWLLHKQTGLSAMQFIMPLEQGDCAAVAEGWVRKERAKGK